MGKHRFGAALLIWLIPALLAGPAGANQLRDPWYSDVWGHWAGGYISIMWQEDTLDGYLSLGYALFYPDRKTTRAEFTVMTAKTFRLEPLEQSPPTFLDVPLSYRFFDRKQAHPYVESAYASGIVQGTGNGYFLPDALLTREEAITIIIRALGLDPYARSLSAEAVGYYLRRFSDGESGSSYARPYLATAIALRLLNGYGDGTIRPRGLLSRAEAATVLHRSCLVSAIPGPNPFSPDSDGIEDQTVFLIKTLKNRAITRWKLEIVNLDGDRIFADLNPGLFGSPPRELSWDGRGDDGRALPFGRYFYRIRVWDYLGNLFSSPILPIVLEKKALSASIAPALTQPGGWVNLRASTTGAARKVTAITPDGRAIPLQPEASSLSGDPNATQPWSAPYEVGPSTAEGDYRVTFRAEYATTVRTAVVTFTVRSPLSLYGEIVPNPAGVGSGLTISAIGSENLASITAELPWGTIDLNRSSPRAWSAAQIVPGSAEVGTHGVTLTGRSGLRSVQYRLNLEITGNPLDSVQFILTD